MKMILFLVNTRNHNFIINNDAYDVRIILVKNNQNLIFNRTDIEENISHLIICYDEQIVDTYIIRTNIAGITSNIFIHFFKLCFILNVTLDIVSYDIYDVLFFKFFLTFKSFKYLIRLITNHKSRNISLKSLNQV